MKLFESATGIDAGYRAQKLMERLTGPAWAATENLDLQELKHEDGVRRLLKHLYQELEPLEHLRVFSTLTEFYRGFKRLPNQEFIEYRYGVSPGGDWGRHRRLEQGPLVPREGQPLGRAAETSYNGSRWRVRVHPFEESADGHRPEGEARRRHLELQGHLIDSGKPSREGLDK